MLLPNRCGYCIDCGIRLRFSAFHNCNSLPSDTNRSRPRLPFRSAVQRRGTEDGRSGRISMSFRVAGLFGLTTALMASTSALAQQAAQGVSASDQGAAVQEVVVTANRRSEDVQRVPLAVAAVSAKQVAQLGIVDPQSLASAVPGLQFNRQVGSAIPFLRGVGTAAGGPGHEPSVAMYVDDVYMP